MYHDTRFERSFAQPPPCADDVPKGIYWVLYEALPTPVYKVLRAICIPILLLLGW